MNDIIDQHKEQKIRAAKLKKDHSNIFDILNDCQDAVTESNELDGKIDKVNSDYKKYEKAFKLVQTMIGKKMGKIKKHY